jgi:hypothetical protein
MPQVVISVRDEILRTAAHAAEESQRRVEEVLADWLERAITEMPVETFSDEEILALTEQQLKSEDQDALSDLLVRSREGQLDAEGQDRLDALMGGYERGLLRKAQALRVAVQRGLRVPLQP